MRQSKRTVIGQGVANRERGKRVGYRGKAVLLIGGRPGWTGYPRRGLVPHKIREQRVRNFGGSGRDKMEEDSSENK